ncbi:MAG: hypothetical protein KJ583_05570 [Nanoarchaeota archaeon]|nr:hypothetical protein [Nanoarchaeota archaeon]MBU1269041.1 hypothetical protein [Nanoarchaeota archaeon]MBU1604760.1 hypothetical protein [Nanoarchaeota archaeon]MBU2443374.1 hypothetical protein [Nanoarchaeota archaeon]
MTYEQKLELLEDITSKEFLDDALSNAKTWCWKNLSKHLEGFIGDFDFRIFNYKIDNSKAGLGYDMFFDEKENGLIRVCTKQLEHYQERENYIKENSTVRRGDIGDKSVIIYGAVEVDSESMFVHEITEYVLLNPNLFDIKIYIDKYFGMAHKYAYEMENINRQERGLQLWPR